MQLYLLYLQIIPTFVPIKSNPIINKTSTAVMKKKTILFASCLFGVFAFSSCEKNLYDESKQPEKEKRMTDLEVPADFDWKGSQNAKVKIASQSTATISVFLEENCNEEALMLRMEVDANTSELELPIEIPAYIAPFCFPACPTAVPAKGSFSEISLVFWRPCPNDRHSVPALRRPVLNSAKARINRSEPSTRHQKTIPNRDTQKTV